MKKMKLIVLLLAVFAAFILGIFTGKEKTEEKREEKKTDRETAAETWTCSMHPQIRQHKPGRCPLCGMNLIPVKDHSGAASSPSEVKFTREAEKLIEVETAPAARRYLDREVRMQGKIDYNEETMAFITARIPGRIDRLFVNYTGIAVKKGDHMAEVYSPELLLAQQELITALQLLKKTKDDNDFAEKTMKSVLEKYRFWGFSEAQVKEIIDRKKVSDWLTITAPITGIVVEKMVNTGEYFETGKNLFRIADLKQVWVNLEAYEADLPFLKYGQDVEFSMEAYPGKTFKGRIAFIQPFVNEMTRTVKVRLNTANRDGILKPGMFVTAAVRARVAENGKIITPSLAGKWISPMHPEIIKDKPGICDICEMPLVSAESLGFAEDNPEKNPPPLTIPSTAPLLTGKRAIVYVAVPGKQGVYEGREVKLGYSNRDYSIVESGLREGENVVVRGNFKIDSAAQILGKRSMINTDSENNRAETAEHRKPDEKKQPSASSPLPDGLLDSYFETGKALFRDNLKDALKNASALDRRYSTKLSHAKDLKSARENFGLISLRLNEELSGNRGNVKRTVYRFSCPMAFDDRGSIWLQAGTKTENPYFGPVMPECGELQETIAAGKQPHIH
ncbi:MAG: Cation efflux system protein CusB precursor [Lentisphaerae bacterium ADurb.Bin242]|nr:MAG: Cation efflux system protein CusB precursor [Lentisphaerae bacterium ADurb.Bin242]